VLAINSRKVLQGNIYAVLEVMFAVDSILYAIGKPARNMRNQKERLKRYGTKVELEVD
jgi:hypothetical protein